MHPFVRYRSTVPTHSLGMSLGDDVTPFPLMRPLCYLSWAEDFAPGTGHQVNLAVSSLRWDGDLQVRFGIVLRILTQHGQRLTKQPLARQASHGQKFLEHLPWEMLLAPIDAASKNTRSRQVRHIRRGFPACLETGTAKVRFLQGSLSSKTLQSFQQGIVRARSTVPLPYGRRLRRSDPGDEETALEDE